MLRVSLLLIASAAANSGSCADGSCEARAALDYEDADDEISLLQHAAAKVSVDAGLPVESAQATASSFLSAFASRRWGDILGSRRRSASTAESRCNGGAFVKYSNVHVEEGLQFHYNILNMNGVCSSTTSWGPNECCLPFGGNVTATSEVRLPEALDEGAEMHVSVSGWYGWIPLRDSLSCKACGEPCRACPSISKYLPWLFKCVPKPMPPCPIAAGSVTNFTTVSLSEEMHRKLKGSSATVDYRLTRSGGSVVASGQVYVKAT
eukprot:gb/GFBE01075344.1/.p1 GENE.gb/GFBE01075344.1/~~gb/GFBE01075344.1/.p1  ORF type:complete len:264 (+),score=46.59 gb/GFBE01075344.1/:1-792(+)